MPQPKRILMTGGRGRLASLIADHFRAPLHDVRLFSRLTGDGFGSLDELQKSEVLARADTVLHLAWSTFPATSEKDPQQEWKHDLPLLDKMLTALAASAAREKLHLCWPAWPLHLSLR